MTDVKLTSVFASLKSKADELNEASDAINEALAAAEQQIVDLNIGIEIWHDEPLDTTDAVGGIGPNDISSETYRVLGLARVAGSWCLAVKSMRRDSGYFEGDIGCPYTNEFLEVAPQSLMSQSRDLRIRALTLLPNFLVALGRGIEQKLTELAEANDKLRDVSEGRIGAKL